MPPVRTFALVCGMVVVVLYSTAMAYGNQPDAPAGPAATSRVPQG